MTPPGCIALRVQVGWGDCDPAGIVFFPRFYAWMDGVSHRLAREMGVSRDAMTAPRSDLLGFPVVTTHAEFLHPARVDDVLDIRGWVTRVGRSSLDILTEVVRPESDGSETLLVRGQETRVFIVHTTDGLRPRELTPAMRDALAPFLDPRADATVTTRADRAG
ncbi:MAG: acyl-CoA thioesterase [Chloroflexota bacterium]